MQAIPLDVIHDHLVQTGDGLDGPVGASHTALTGPSPDVGSAHRGLYIDVDARGGGIGDGVDVILDILNLVAVEHTHLEGCALVESHRGR